MNIINILIFGLLLYLLEIGKYNSSNISEKANDLLVADKQKNNGKSWSKLGSVALASLTALVKNSEYKN